MAKLDRPETGKAKIDLLTIECHYDNSGDPFNIAEKTLEQPYKLSAEDYLYTLSIVNSGLVENPGFCVSADLEANSTAIAYVLGALIVKAQRRSNKALLRKDYPFIECFQSARQSYLLSHVSPDFPKGALSSIPLDKEDKLDILMDTLKLIGKKVFQTPSAVLKLVLN